MGCFVSHERDATPNESIASQKSRPAPHGRSPNVKEISQLPSIEPLPTIAVISATEDEPSSPVPTHTDTSVQPSCFGDTNRRDSLASVGSNWSNQANLVQPNPDGCTSPRITREETDLAKSMDRESLDLFLSVVNAGGPSNAKGRRGSHSIWARSTTPLSRRVQASVVQHSSNTAQ